MRITVDRDEAAKAVPRIRERLAQMGVHVPLVGDFHYNGHTLLAENPACAEALDKYRINPGNVGFKAKRDRQFSAIIELALRYGKPVRIGVNWGSLDQELLTRLMDENAASPEPKDARAIMHEAIVQSGLLSAERAEELGHGAGAASSSRPRSAPCRTWSASTRCWPRAAATPCIWGSPRPAWAPRASSPPRPPWASCCSRASATPSASR